MHHKDPSPYDLFGMRLAMDVQSLRRIGRPFFRPTNRMADAADEIILALGDAASTGKPRPH